MQDKELFDKVVTHIGEFIEADTSHLTPDSRLATSIQGLNSLKMFELILYLEDCFGMSFGEDVMDKIDTMDDLVGYIRERMTAGVQPA
ncbi:acyl carrier protein [Arenibaculum sp.]|jgi:acyl carrier protein|uniref:acyl carrier protein n=1 Tax=Arenibaculum sp. TaxID=2865862 RepID=UPI002E0E878D|nr:phosphopantetheine-binding protein [Arenibaculum sp.]